MRRALAALALVAALALPWPAAGHEVLHEVRPGGAVAVRVRYADGEPLAYAQYELFSPADPKIAWQKGRTDREGWLSFVPSPAGAWRLRVVGADGHGLDTALEVGAGAAAAPAGAAGAGGALRTVAGVLLIGALFGGLLLLARRRGAKP